MNWIFTMKPLNWHFQQHFGPNILIITKYFGDSFFPKLRNERSTRNIANVWHHFCWRNFNLNFKNAVFWTAFENLTQLRSEVKNKYSKILLISFCCDTHQIKLSKKRITYKVVMYTARPYLLSEFIYQKLCAKF